jgi:hypothetical protein
LRRAAGPAPTSFGVCEWRCRRPQHCRRRLLRRCCQALAAQIAADLEEDLKATITAAEQEGGGAA